MAARRDRPCRVQRCRTARPTMGFEPPTSDPSYDSLKPARNTADPSWGGSVYGAGAPAAREHGAEGFRTGQMGRGEDREGHRSRPPASPTDRPHAIATAAPAERSASSRSPGIRSSPTRRPCGPQSTARCHRSSGEPTLIGRTSKVMRRRCVHVETRDGDGGGGPTVWEPSCSSHRSFGTAYGARSFERCVLGRRPHLTFLPEPGPLAARRGGVFRRRP